MKIRRINLYGGPGSGKSTTAGLMFSALKQNGYEAEWCQEYVKTWTFINRVPQGYDQVYIFGKQINREDTILRSNDNILVVNDAPLLLNAWYAHYLELPGEKEILSMARDFEKKYPSINILLRRKGLSYSEVGRFQNAEEATVMDVSITAWLANELDRGCLSTLHSTYHEVDTTDVDTLFGVVLGDLTK